MKMNETVAGLTITAKTEGVDQVKKQVEGLTKSTEQLGVASETTSKGARSLEESWKRATLRFDETARAQANMTRETKLAEAAVRNGIATQQQAADHLKLVAQRYGEVATAAQKMTAGMSASGTASPREFDSAASQRMLAGMSSGGEQAAKGIGLARHELINLSRQAQDVGVSLASGQSPLTVLMQQGTQIADVFISSGKSVGSFFSQAIGWAGSFLASTAGIVTAIAAFGVAAVYAMSQFVTASKTVEQALEEQNRLLKEGKALIDARTSAEARAQLNLKGQTQFETQRNLLDVQLKLNKAMEEVATIAERRATTPTGGGMPEMGIAPSGVQALKDPGYAEIKTAVDNLNAALASGQPGLKQFNDELGKIGLAHPELGNFIEKLMATGQELENATLKAKAMSDALKGIATDAQLAAVGRGSIAQFQLNNRMADEARASTERQAKAVLQMAEKYPGMSIEVGKTLEGLKGQLSVAEAIGKQDEIAAQRKATINQLMLEGKTPAEAVAIANAQAAIAQAQINAEHEKRMMRLADELNIAQQMTGIGQINAQHAARINQLLQEGFSITQATAQADKQREIALAQVNVAAQQQLRTLQEQGDVLRASPGLEQDRVRAMQEYVRLLEKGVDVQTASAIASQMIANAEKERANQHETTMVSLQGQLAVAQQMTGIGQINAQHEADINNLLQQGLSLSQAIEQADMKRSIALAQVNTQAEQQLKTLQDEYAVIVASDKARVRAQQEYNKLVEQGVRPELARKIADQSLRNARATEDAAEAAKNASNEANDAIHRVTNGTNAASAAAQQLEDHWHQVGRTMAFLPIGILDEMAYKAGVAIEQLEGLFRAKDGGYSQFDPKGYTSTTTAAGNSLFLLQSQYGPGGFDPKTGMPNAQGLAYQYRGTSSAAAILGGGLTSTQYTTGLGGFAMPQTTLDPGRVSMAQRAIELLPKEQQLGPLQQMLGLAKAVPASLEQAELVKTLTDKIQQLTEATDANTSATSAMTDVLSPFYSSDPRRTHLGFRSFAGGGIMTQYGELPLRQYQGGGMATSPQVAVYGEGSTPEAFVPVPSGRIPVELKQPANSNQRPVNVTINVMGSADASTVQALKSTAFQQAQSMRRAMR